MIKQKTIIEQKKGQKKDLIKRQGKMKFKKRIKKKEEELKVKTKDKPSTN